MHKDLLVYQKSIDFVTEIYKATKSFPKDEMFGIVSQIRRAAVSIPANLAEGSARNGKREFNQFLHISLGSSVELETLLLISKNVNYIDEIIYQELNYKLTEIIKMLNGLIKSIKNPNH